MKILFEAPHAKQRYQRWCVYSHFDPNGHVQPYVIYALQRLHTSGLKIAVFSTSPHLSPIALEALQAHATTVVQRDNVGYDFGSYKMGIQYLREINALPTQLLLTNDSVYGPLQPIDSILQQAAQFDLYGLTDSVEHSYHLQSYFLVYGQQVLQTKAFTDFWDGVQLIDKTTKEFKQKIIMQYEVGGSQYFLRKGFTLGAAFKFKNLAQAAWREFEGQLDNAQQQPGYTVTKLKLGYNITHQYWRELVLAGCPYIKRELLAVNPINIDIHDWPTVLAHHTEYPVVHVIQSLRQQQGSDDFFFTTNQKRQIVQFFDEKEEVNLPVNPSFAPWSDMFKTPTHRRFVFDEAFYLDQHGDVRKSVAKGIMSSGLQHFVQHGYKEERAIRLAPVSVTSLLTP